MLNISLNLNFPASVSVIEAISENLHSLLHVYAECHFILLKHNHRGLDQYISSTYMMFFLLLSADP